MSPVSLHVKRGLGRLAALARPFRAVPRRRVLTFHEIGDHPWGCTPARFATILDLLRERAEVVPLAGLLEEGESPGLRVALAFDDAYAGVARNAAPALEARGLSATVFVPTDLLAEATAVPRQDRGLYAGAPLMGWEDVARWGAKGVLSFESHGAGHIRYSASSAEEVAGDLRRSRETLLQRTGREPSFLAYPYGDAGGGAAAAARALGFRAAFGTIHGGIGAADDPFRLRRVDVRAEFAPGDVMAALRGDWDFLGPWQRARA